jgi:hypothetical protein
MEDRLHRLIDHVLVHLILLQEVKRRTEVTQGRQRGGTGTFHRGVNLARSCDESGPSPASSPFLAGRMPLPRPRVPARSAQRARLSAIRLLELMIPAQTVISNSNALCPTVDAPSLSRALKGQVREFSAIFVNCVSRSGLIQTCAHMEGVPPFPWRHDDHVIAAINDGATWPFPQIPPPSHWSAGS